MLGPAARHLPWARLLFASFPIRTTRFPIAMPSLPARRSAKRIERNRCKRLVREALRNLHPSLKQGNDIVVILRGGPDELTGYEHGPPNPRTLFARARLSTGPEPGGRSPEKDQPKPAPGLQTWNSGLNFSIHEIRSRHSTGTPPLIQDRSLAALPLGVPFPADLLGLHLRGHRKTRSHQGKLAGSQAARPLRSLEQGRLRPGTGLAGSTQIQAADTQVQK